MSGHRTISVNVFLLELIENQVPQGTVLDAAVELGMIQVAVIPETGAPLLLEAAPKVRKAVI